MERYNNEAFDYKFLIIKTNLGFTDFVISIENRAWQNPPLDGMIEKKYNTNTIGGEGEYTACGNSGECDNNLLFKHWYS